MPDLASLMLGERASFATAGRRLAAELEGTFAQEPVEQFLATSYDQLADRATFDRFLPLMAERFARQRLSALAKVEV